MMRSWSCLLVISYAEQLTIATNFGQVYLSRRASFFFFQAEDGIRDVAVTGVQTCALPIYAGKPVVEADDEADAHHPARRHHVDARALLVEERRLRGILHELTQVHGAHPSSLHRLAGKPHPPGEAVAAHHRGRQQHHVPPRFRARIASIARRCSGDSTHAVRATSISFRNVSKSRSKARVVRRLLAVTLDGGRARKRATVSSSARAESAGATTRFTRP